MGQRHSTVLAEITGLVNGAKKTASTSFVIKSRLTQGRVYDQRNALAISNVYAAGGGDGLIKIKSAKVYDLDESIAASKYPMQVEPDPRNDLLTPTAVKLAQSPAGEGHDNWLMGVRIAFDINLTAKALVEAERYHFFDIVSCNSTMHRITKFDVDKAYCRYVDNRMIPIMKELVCAYNDDPTPDNYLRILYSNPAGFTYTMRITTNYRQLKTIYKQRRTHRLPEWREFCEWIKSLPHSELIVGAAA